MSWWCIPDNHSVVVEKLELRQMINDNYQNQLIIDQQQCINLALRDSVNDFGQFRRSMFL